MKTLLIFLFLTGCASMNIASDKNVKDQCPIGYHLDQVNSIELFKPKKPETKDSEKKSRYSQKLQCVLDSDQNEFFKQHN